MVEEPRWTSTAKTRAVKGLPKRLYRAGWSSLEITAKTLMLLRTLIYGRAPRA